jgi:outer membrane lipoprotein
MTKPGIDNGMRVPQRMTWTVICLVFLVGCGSAISTEIRDQVDSSATFKAVSKDPDRFKGKIVLWGGVIIGIHNTREASWLELLQEPLGGNDRPIQGALSEGRFLIRHEDFLDPAIYVRGREMTIAGEVVGGKNRSIDGVEYHFPVVESKQMVLWSPQTDSNFHIGIGLGATIVR